MFYHVLVTKFCIGVHFPDLTILVPVVTVLPALPEVHEEKDDTTKDDKDEGKVEPRLFVPRMNIQITS